MSDQVIIALISAILTFSMSAFAAIMAYLSNRQGAVNAIAIDATKKTIVTLEKNTNSMKDALVKVTGEAEFAKGLKLGAGAGSPEGVQSIVTDAQIKAADSEGMLKGAMDEKARGLAATSINPTETSALPNPLPVVLVKETEKP